MLQMSHNDDTLSEDLFSALPWLDIQGTRTLSAEPDPANPMGIAITFQTSVPILCRAFHSRCYRWNTPEEEGGSHGVV
jgi:hypothetical protein